MALNFSSATVRTGSTPVTAAPLTMAAWIRPSAGVNGGILNIGLSGTVRHNFNLYADTAAVYTQAQETTLAYATSSAAPTIDAWNHVCGVEASSTSRTVYLNGGNSGTDTTAKTPTGMNEIVVGVDQRGLLSPAYFAGDVAEVAIWSAALDAAEVAALARGFSPDQIRPASLVWYRSLLTFDNWWNSPNLGPDFTTNTAGITQVAHCRQFYKKRRGFGAAPAAATNHNNLLLLGVG